MVTAGEACGKVLFCICGTYGSLCCLLLSVWGTLMLFLLGIFYYVEAVVLFEDIQSQPLLLNVSSPDLPPGTYFDGVDYYDTDLVSSGYQTAAYACWGAAFVYLLFAVLSGSFVAINAWRAKVAKQH